MILRGKVLLVLWAAVLGAQVVPDQYIVELASPPALAVRAAKGAAQARADVLARIRAEQEVVRSEVERRGGRVLGRTERVANALVVDLTAADAAVLASHAQVRRVYPVVEYHATLDRAAALHNFKAAWEAIGGMQVAGLGAKIGILDTGIDQTHPAFQDSSLQPPEGYPKTGEGDAEFTNNKIIVARHYIGPNAGDGHGHGTGVAMAAAGLPVDAAGVAIAGAAPKAFLGSYKVLSDSGTGNSGVALRALDDAVADGMDVVNLSFGHAGAPRPGDDPVANAIERTVAAGVLVVVSAGNEGSDPNTIGSPGTANSAITVGGVRTGASVELQGLPAIFGSTAVEAAPREPLAGPMLDLERIDATSLGCQPLPEQSLTGRIALILRGECTFEQKLNNAQAAGALGAIIYTHAQAPVPAGWVAGTATLPAVMISNAGGLQIKKQLAGSPDNPAKLDFQRNLVWDFSSRGPNADLSIKPDLIALGSNVRTAGQTRAPGGEMYSADGYLVVSGTSFSAPIVTGAAAVLKAARPGLSAQDYRSLLINSASLFNTGSPRLRVQQTGAGMLDLFAGLRNTLAAYPAALGFGAGAGTFEFAREIEMGNAGNTTDTYEVTLDAVNGPAPTVSSSTFEFAPGQRGKIWFWLAGRDLPPGEYQGFVQIRGLISGTVTRIPYWYAVQGGAPAYLTILSTPGSARAGGTGSIAFRITDAAGLPAGSVQPQVTVVSGGGEALEVAGIDAQVPGAWSARVRMGPQNGANVFEIRAGDLPPAMIRITTSELPEGHP